MKKVFLICAMVLLISALSGCGGSQDQTEGGQGSQESKYADSLDVLNQIVAVYSEGDLFGMYGGNQDNAVMDGPGKFDISKTEELTFSLGLPESQIPSIDDAASMVHMMNANTFTGAAYHLKEGTDVDSFADEVKESIMNTQWVCGFPDTLLIINAGGGYVITAYGEAEIMDTFKANVQSALEGAKIVVEAPIA